MLAFLCDYNEECEFFVIVKWNEKQNSIQNKVKKKRSYRVQLQFIRVDSSKATITK